VHNKPNKHKIWLCINYYNYTTITMLKLCKKVLQITFMDFHNHSYKIQPVTISFFSDGTQINV